VLRGTFVIALLVAAVFAPAAIAAHKPKPRVRLPLLPLPQATLGAEGASLQLQWQDSGPVTNDDAASSANGNVTPQRLKKLGRVLGYSLDYGDPFTGAVGVTEIKTAVDEYKTAADATRGLALWRKDGAQISTLAQGNFTLTIKKLKPRRVGQAGFSYLISKQAANLSPIYLVDEQAREGRYILDARIGAGGQSAAISAASAVARKLDARIRKAVAGHLRGKPVAIPFPPDSGPPPEGPDLSKLVLQPGDVGQTQIQNLLQGYGTAPYAVSDYSMVLTPAGPYDFLTQDLSWYPTAIEATEIDAYAGFFGGDFQVIGGGGLTFTDTPVNVSSAGDNATAEIVEVGSSSGGAFFSFAFVTLRKAQLVDSVTLLSENAVDPTGLQSVANAMASRLDAGFSG
jgi:hypothetical protein